MAQSAGPGSEPASDRPGAPRYEVRDGVALVTLDDGRANAISSELLLQLDALLDRAEGDEQVNALVVTGRPGRFSAGFDLAAMTAGPESMRQLVTAGARFLMRLYGYGLPTVAACTGHALAAGALLLLACDTRVGTAGDFKIGLNEVAIGMPLPVFAVEMARDRLEETSLVPATLQARIHSPDEAARAGFLDSVVGSDRVVEAAVEEAARLAQLRRGAYARTKRAVRDSTIEHVLATLDADLSGVDGPR